MHPYSFIISLRAKHKNEDLGFLSGLFGKEPTVTWKSGDERKTPKGTSLGGLRNNSYWVTNLSDGETDSEEWQLEDYLEKILSEIETIIPDLQEFVSKDGVLIFYISLYGSRNFGIILSPAILNRISEIGIELQFDIYPENYKK